MTAAAIADWVVDDAEDDFFPDPVGLEDLREWRGSTLPELSRNQRDRKMLLVPKSGLFRREVTLLSPAFRLRYGSYVAALLPAIARNIHPRCFGFSRQQLRHRSPLQGGRRRWLEFTSRFREELVESNGWGVVTDITAYFDNISRRLLLSQLRSYATSEPERHAVEGVSECLRWLRSPASGLPQNNDFSSVFGNSFLTPLDRNAERLPGKTLRFSDDIRIVARTRSAAIDAFSGVQGFLRSQGLHLNSAKTKLLQPGTDDWRAFVDSSLEFKLSKIDEFLDIGDPAALRKAANLIVEELRAPRSLRETRAYSNRAMRIPAGIRNTTQLRGQLDRIALAGFYNQPDGADLWMKLLDPSSDTKIARQLATMLFADDYNRSPWVNTWAIRWFASAHELPGSILDRLMVIATDPAREFVERSNALLALSSHNALTSAACESVLSECPCDYVFRSVAAAAYRGNESAFRRIVAKLRSASPFARSLLALLESGWRPKARSTVAEPRRPTFGLVDGLKRIFKIPNATSDYE